MTTAGRLIRRKKSSSEKRHREEVKSDKLKVISGLAPPKLTSEGTYYLLLITLILSGLPSCHLPTVNLGTPDPIKVDVSMRLNVYQYRGDEPNQPNAEQKGHEEATERLRNRMAEIQTLKDNRIVGEDHRGLLHVRSKPGGDWGTRVETAVAEENEDRTILMRREAKDGNKELHAVQAEQWKARTANAFKGEWIEVAGDKPDTFKWMQAEGVKTKKEAKEEAKKAAEAPAKAQ
jgi:hypothetical protein